MDKSIVIENAKKKFSGELLNIVLEQIDDHYKLIESNYEAKNKYNVGDDVILNKNHLLHGLGKHTDLIEDIFAKRGIVSQDFFGDDSNHAFCYTAAFWTVDKEITLKDFVKNYSGMIVKYNDKYEQVPYGELDNFVEKMKEIDHWLWTAESSMEIRFMPSIARNINQVGFIVNTENEMCQKLRKNSVFKADFNNSYAYEFVSGKAKEKFEKEGFTSDFFLRADYLIYGIPKCCIEGILVGKDLEADINNIKKLKELFPKCYICNLDGKVILK